MFKLLTPSETDSHILFKASLDIALQGGHSKSASTGFKIRFCDWVKSTLAQNLLPLGPICYICLL